MVLEELREGSANYPELASALHLDWINVARLHTLDEIKRFTEWVRRIGKGWCDCGESSVLAVAESKGGIALTDDREATLVGRAYNVEVHGTVWLLAGACRDGKLTLVAAGTLIDGLRATGMRLPCTGPEFPDYARRHGLL